jgi:hypothetical protein
MIYFHVVTQLLGNAKGDKYSYCVFLRHVDRKANTAIISTTN